MSDRGVRSLTLGVLAALGLFCVWRLDLTHSITHFLPSEDDAELVDLSLELVDSPLARRMVLAIGGGPERVAAAQELAAALRAHPEVAWVEAGIDEDALRGLYEVYFERRIYLASDAPETEIPPMLEAASLERRAGELRRRLSRPDSPLLARIAPADPLGLFELVLRRMGGAQPARPATGGRFTSVDGDHAIVLLGLRSSPFESIPQSSLLDEIEARFSRIDAAHGGGLLLEQSGVNRIAVASERVMRDDVNFISAVSTTGVLLLFILFFRSLRTLLVALLVPAGGFIVATAVLLSCAAPLHVITLGFGFALTGIAIDYPTHLITHHAASPAGTLPRATLARIRAPLLASGATTALAFAILGFSEFPGLAEMGSFAAVGVAAALAISTFCLPAFLGPGGASTQFQVVLAGALGRVVRWLDARPGLAALVPLAFLGIVASGLPRLQWEDDPASLMVADPSLLAEDERVRGLVADVDPGRVVVALGSDPESALALNDRVYRRLRDAVDAGHLAGVRSLHSFLWSQGLQRENLVAFRSAADLGRRIDRAFSRNGFRPAAFRSFAEAVASPTAAPLVPEDLVGSPLERALDSLTQFEGRWVAVTGLRGVRSGAGIRDALDGLEGAHYLDQQEIVGELYERYRRSTLEMVAVGCAGVLLILQLRYRSLARALLAFLPSALVALTTLGIFGVLGIVVNVVAAVSLVVVVGLGVDYGIFSVDGARNPQDLSATMLSLVVCSLTTIFAFGTLALSSQPALRAMGLTIGTGILLALMISPAVYVLARRVAPS